VQNTNGAGLISTFTGRGGARRNIARPRSGSRVSNCS
jgi:hypothetical protein